MPKYEYVGPQIRNLRKLSQKGRGKLLTKLGKINFSEKALLYVVPLHRSWFSFNLVSNYINSKLIFLTEKDDGYQIKISRIITLKTRS